MSVSPVPQGFHTLTPHLTVAGALEAIGFYQRAVGAELIAKSLMPDGQTVANAMLRVGDSMLMLNDEFPGQGCAGAKSLGGSPVVLHLYVEDADAAFERAAGAGCTVTMPLENTFWGDRYGVLEDPYGHRWSIATHVEDVPPEDMERRMAEAFSQAPE
jgi:uncharacterized glyoxalase superfamily protein PhnB